MKKKAYIFDIDGTLADCSHRLRYILPKKELFSCPVEDLDKFAPDWDKFHADCVNDAPIEPTIAVLSGIMETDAEILFVTGRPESIREATDCWLFDNAIGDYPYYKLFMRAENDHRPDYVVKKEIYEDLIKNWYNVVCVFEDRKQCVDMWRSLGLTCFQVADGDY